MTNSLLTRKQAKGSDYFYTPEYGIKLLSEEIKDYNFKSMWECSAGDGRMAQYFRNLGYKVKATDARGYEGVGEFDFLSQTSRRRYDFIFTNPPYSIKNKFILKCEEYNVVYALLLPLTALEGKVRQKVWARGTKILLPNKRINFEKVGMEKGTAWFATAWFLRDNRFDGCQIKFKELDR